MCPSQAIKMILMWNRLWYQQQQQQKKRKVDNIVSFCQLQSKITKRRLGITNRIGLSQTYRYFLIRLHAQSKAALIFLTNSPRYHRKREGQSQGHIHLLYLPPHLEVSNYIRSKKKKKRFIKMIQNDLVDLSPSSLLLLGLFFLVI